MPDMSKLLLLSSDLYFPIPTGPILGGTDDGAVVVEGLCAGIIRILDYNNQGGREHIMLHEH